MKTVFDERIKRVIVTASDRFGRAQLLGALSGAGADVLMVDGPLPPIKDALKSLFDKGGNAIVSGFDNWPSDFPYFPGYSGAKLVALAFQFGMPGVLTGVSSTRNDSDATEIRRWRRWIPTVITGASDYYDREDFVEGINTCLREHAGEWSSARKPWRVLVRVEKADFAAPVPYVNITLPSWSARDDIKILVEDIPDAIVQKIKAGEAYFYATANKGTENFDDLYVVDWRED